MKLANKQTLARFAQNLTPPFLWRIYLRLIKKTGFFGDYKSWEEAVRSSSGYDADLILAKVKSAAAKVRDGEAVYERDSVLLGSIEYSWPLLSALLWVASKNNNRINVLDFGGSLGSSYYQNREFFSHLNVSWNIVEQPAFVEAGRSGFSNDNLSFYKTIEDCLKHQTPDVVLLSSVLPYLKNPYAFLSNLVQYQIPYMIIDRTPLLAECDDRLTIQRVPAEIYDASYPAWFFSREKILHFFRQNYIVNAEFEALAGGIDLGGAQAVDTGFILSSKNIAEKV